MDNSKMDFGSLVVGLALGFIFTLLLMAWSSPDTDIENLCLEIEDVYGMVIIYEPDEDMCCVGHTLEELKPLDSYLTFLGE